MLSQDLKSGNYFVLKKLQVNLLRNSLVENNKTAFDLMIEELKVLESIKHPNLNRLYDIINEGENHD